MSDLILGIDVSEVQGNIDWARVKADGYRFASVKCTQGNDGVDKNFVKNVRDAAAAGLAVNAYHFHYPLPDAYGHKGRDPISQAKAFFDACNSAGRASMLVGDMRPAFDFEWPAPQDWAKWGVTAKQMAVHALATLDEISQRFGQNPIVYTYPDFWSHMMWHAEDGAFDEFAEYDLWLADYGKSPRILPPWGGCRLWQRSGGTEHLSNGVPCDVDVFEGTEEEFEAFLIQEST